MHHAHSMIAQSTDPSLVILAIFAIESEGHLSLRDV